MIRWQWILSGSVCLFIGLASRAFAQSPPASATKADAPSAAASPNIAVKGAVSKDEQTIRQGAANFSRAFQQADAKAIAGMWVENGEYQDDEGRLLHGRDNIEQAYTELFAEKKAGKIDVDVQTVRFLTPDLAVEEGILHESSAGRELPTTTRYAAIDVRDGDTWKIAQCREWGGGQDHLDDLNWLVGKWHGSSKDQDMDLSFAWDEKQPILLAKLAAKPAATSKVPAQSGTIKIGYDARRGGFHSWHTDQDGSQSRAQWTRDGNRWLVNASGLTSDGQDIAAQYILTRIDNDNFTWRAVSRTLGGQPMPDSVPIRLTRVAGSK
jgi:uncharacterized protein (TIGR02246 family)